MSKPSKSKNNNNNSQTSSSCFTTIFQRFICSGNLPTHPPLPDQKLENPAKIHPFTRPVTHSNNDSTSNKSSQVQAHNNPGIVARLMGLDSLPKNAIVTSDMLFRSKSMNSMHFLPDFDPTRASFHRRARTSASFHDQGHKFLVKIDENMVSDDIIDKEYEMGFGYKNQREKEKNENELLGLKDECKKSRQKNSGRTKNSGSKNRYDEYYTSSSSSSCGRRRNKLKNSVDVENGGISGSNNYCLIKEKCEKQKMKLVLRNKGEINGKIGGSTVCSSKKKVDHKQQMCNGIVQSDDSQSPVSVLDHHQEIFPTSKGEGRRKTSNSRRKTSPKGKLYDNITQDLVPKSKQYNQKCSDKIARKQEVVKEEIEASDSLVEMLGHISKLAEDHIIDSKWVANYDVLKVQFMDELCMDLGQEVLDLLLDELVDMIIMMAF